MNAVVALDRQGYSADHRAFAELVVPRTELFVPQPDDDEDIVAEARRYFKTLQNAVHRGVGDTDGAARERLAGKLKIEPSYLRRLDFKWQEMNGEIRGTVYRTLKRAHEKYEAACRRLEEGADRDRQERLQLKAERNAAFQERAHMGAGTAPAFD